MDFVEDFNKNQSIVAIAALLSVIGGRVLYTEIASNCNEYFQNYTSKFLIILAMLFMSTRNISISLVYAFIGIVLFRILVNGKKKKINYA